MKKLILLSVLFLTACGGGSSSNDFDDFESISAQRIQGPWLSDCYYDVDGDFSYREEIEYYGYDYFETQFYFDTVDCSGPSDNEYVEGDITYLGEYATSICIGEQYIVDNLTLEIDGFFSDIRGFKGIACTFDNTLFIGETDIDSSRPTSVDISFPYY
ncbi:hypothetical protein [uncultured Cocleimonas sp.]|uniref:hypothetical protein n=1 Tax=uncultured Cocleimonas sp. TaxID=1051587 RepID=UPI0026142FCD|nr:hypothetical protein [uncultured Cocleimonas sp.]